MLYACDLARANRVHSFIEPADSGAECNTIVTNFTGLLQSFERFPQRVVFHLLHADVVQLQQVNPISFQPLERRICRASDGLGRKVLRNLPLAAPASLSVSDKIVTDLGRNYDFVAIFWERLGDVFLT